jgi:hypothetical protein
MASESYDIDDCTPTVKNTFITFATRAEAKPRRRSVPASSRLCLPSIIDAKLVLDNIPSDVSTYETDASLSGTRTPMSDYDDPSPAFYIYPQEEFAHPPSSWFVPPPPQPHTELRRLNSRAAAFQPQTEAPAVEEEEDERRQRYKKQVAEVIRLARVSMKWSEHVKDVEVSEDVDGGWNVVVQPKGSDENPFQTDTLLTLAKEALLDAAASSKCIYVMGYCAPKPFDMRAQGFEATLGAMQVAQSACWHVFKKGFCRHAEDCCKEHPGYQAPVHVVVETAQFKSCPRFAHAFKETVADLALSITAEVGESPHVETVAAVKDNDSQGWSIEITAKMDLAECKEYLLTLAKNALFTSTGNSGNVYIMGYAEKPFIKKSEGFVTILGDMQDESRICWDLYAKGVCSRADCTCRWEHPECLMPLNVVVK